MEFVDSTRKPDNRSIEALVERFRAARLRTAIR